MEKIWLVLFLLGALAFVVATNVWLRRRADREGGGGADD